MLSGQGLFCLYAKSLVCPGPESTADVGQGRVCSSRHTGWQLTLIFPFYLENPLNFWDNFFPSDTKWLEVQVLQWARSPLGRIPGELGWKLGDMSREEMGEWRSLREKPRWGSGWLWELSGPCYHGRTLAELRMLPMYRLPSLRFHLSPSLLFGTDLVKLFTQTIHPSCLAGHLSPPVSVLAARKSGFQDPVPDQQGVHKAESGLDSCTAVS